MSRKVDLNEKEQERQVRRRFFLRAFSALTMIFCGFLLWKLRSLLLPIMVGALLAYLFRPLKDRFQVTWIAHEMRVLLLFAAIGAGIFLSVNNLRQHLPSEREKLELASTIKIQRVWRGYMARVAAEDYKAELAEFLRDPVRVRPGGRMPSLALDAGEARASRSAR